MLAQEQLIESNIQLLQQGLALLQQINDDLYCQSSAGTEDAGVGAHLRHCLDHYFSFLEGLAAGEIDYDARRRDPRVASDRQYALRQIEQTIGRLRAAATASLHLSVRVKMDPGGAALGNGAVSESTIGRELQFLISHTVHHYALIALLLRARGIQLHASFGVAPATLRYRQSQQA